MRGAAFALLDADHPRRFARADHAHFRHGQRQEQLFFLAFLAHLLSAGREFAQELLHAGLQAHVVLLAFQHAFDFFVGQALANADERMRPAVGPHHACRRLDINKHRVRQAVFVLAQTATVGRQRTR